MGLVPRRPGRPRSAPLSAAPSGPRAPCGRSPHLSRPARHTPLLTGPPPASIQGAESTDEPRSAGAARTRDIRGVPFDFPVTRALVSVVTISTFLLSVSVHCPLRAEHCSPRWEHGGNTRQSRYPRSPRPGGQKRRRTRRPEQGGGRGQQGPRRAGAPCWERSGAQPGAAIRGTGGAVGGWVRGHRS